MIDAKIAGQGTNVDAGGALPLILNAILDLVSEASEQVSEIGGLIVDVTGKVGLEVTLAEVVAMERAILLKRNNRYYFKVTNIQVGIVDSIKQNAADIIDIRGIFSAGAMYSEGLSAINTCELLLVTTSSDNEYYLTTYDI